MTILKQGNTGERVLDPELLGELKECVHHATEDMPAESENRARVEGLEMSFAEVFTVNACRAPKENHVNGLWGTRRMEKLRRELVTAYVEAVLFKTRVEAQAYVSETEMALLEWAKGKGESLAASKLAAREKKQSQSY